MSYQVLARKWRPRTFDQVVGQEHVVRALSNALQQQRLHHAYLFTGTRGVGKTTLARILAKALNCETGISANPCGQCTACTEIDRGRFVDMLEVDAASNTQVDAMRDLLENAQYAPTMGRFKIYIIDEVHMLSRNAFNAMLKTLEEPPPHVKFILATTDPQRLPVTVLSRCLQFNLKQMGSANIARHLENILQQENIDADSAALNLLSRAAQGSMRDALSLLDQAIAYGSGSVHEQEVRAMLGAIDHTYLFGLLESLLANDGAALMQQIDAMEERGLSFDAALQELAQLLYQMTLAQTVPQAMAADLPEREQILSLAQRVSPEQVQLYYQIATLGRRDLSLAPDEFAGFSMTLLRMLAFTPSDQVMTDAPSVPPSNQADNVSGASKSSPKAEALSGSDQRQASKQAQQQQPDQQPKHRPEKQSESTEQYNAVSKALPASGFNGDWRGFADSLKGGFSKMLAQNCALVSYDEHNIELCIDESQKHLLAPNYQQMLKAALQEHYGKLTLRIKVGRIDNTPAAQISQEKMQRQAGAEEAILGDPFIRELTEVFGASVNPSTIKPI